MSMPGGPRAIQFVLRRWVGSSEQRMEPNRHARPWRLSFRHTADRQLSPDLTNALSRAVYSSLDVLRADIGIDCEVRNVCRYEEA